MKKHPSILTNTLYLFLLASLLSPISPALAGSCCEDIDGLPIACKNQQATKLVVDDCTELDGFAVTCKNQQKTRLDLMAACTDIDGLAIDCGNKRMIEVSMEPLLATKK